MPTLYKTAVIYQLNSLTLQGKGRGVEVTPLLSDLAMKFIDPLNQVEEFNFLDVPACNGEWSNAVYVLHNPLANPTNSYYLITPL